MRSRVAAGSAPLASALNTPLATVSRRVADLEAHLRTRLLIRSSRRLTLTEAGRGYVAVARRILDDLDDAERGASGEYRVPRGHLPIAAPLMFGRLHVAPVVLAFLDAYPDITVRLKLADHVGIAFEGLYSTPSWSFASGGRPLTVPVAPRFAVNTADAAIAAAIAGAGIARNLSYQVAAAVAARELVPVLEELAPPPLPVNLVHAGQTLLPLKLRAFLDFAGPRLRGAIAG